MHLLHLPGLICGVCSPICRIDDEFERIRVLILFHQLQIGEPLSALERIAIGKLWLCGFDQTPLPSAYLPSAARRSAALTICASERPR